MASNLYGSDGLQPMESLVPAPILQRDRTRLAGQLDRIFRLAGRPNRPNLIAFDREPRELL